MNINQRPRVLTVAFAVLFATAFFFAGYSVRTTETAVAAVPIPTPTPTPEDGNPSGHKLLPTVTLVRGAIPANLEASLKVVASYPIAIRWIAVPKDQSPPPDLDKPACDKGAVCFPFHWENMSLESDWPDGRMSGPETVTIDGTLALH